MESERGCINYEKMHRSFDELLAVFIYETGRLPSETTLTKLLEWLYEQISKKKKYDVSL